LRRLKDRYAACTTFAFARDDSCFIGSTPERLVRLDGRAVRANCVAGSAPRGATEDEDRALGKALLYDKKEQHEHALVVSALREALAPYCADLNVPEEPNLLKMPNVQHLHTPVDGVLRDDLHVLDLVACLHPSPAVGGVPQELTSARIESYEPFDRGWYAGPVGWFDSSGDGEFVVAIRSALLREQDVHLYAGCGIVEGSDPEREYAESQLKLEPILWAMSGSDV
jgi:isochorismate synthase